MTRPSLSAASAGLSVWNGRRPGASALSALRIEREAGAAVLHQHAGRRQHAARAELPIERLDVGDGEAGGVGRAHPDGVALAVAAPARARLCGGRSCAASTSRKAGVEETRRSLGDAVRIGDDAVAHAEGALGRFDQAVDVLEALGLARRPAGRTTPRMISEASPCVGGGVL